MNKDLTQGRPVKVLWMFCLPILVSAVFQQFYKCSARMRSLPWERPIL